MAQLAMGKATVQRSPMIAVWEKEAESPKWRFVFFF
jgi:hypothetical protein